MKLFWRWAGVTQPCWLDGHCGSGRRGPGAGHALQTAAEYRGHAKKRVEKLCIMRESVRTAPGKYLAPVMSHCVGYSQAHSFNEFAIGDKLMLLQKS